MRYGRLIFFIGIILLIGVSLVWYKNSNSLDALTNLTDNIVSEIDEEIMSAPHELSIESLRKNQFPGSDLTIEQTLDPGTNYQRYIVSYKSEEHKIYALLTVPNGDPSASSGQGVPEGGFPAIVFNHGFIPPAEYRTTERYIAYTDAFSRNGYVLLRPDYRGHGDSEGSATGGYGSNAYTIDVLNALASLKKYKDVNPNKIGMWGHSMGGHITLRSMVVSKDIKAGVIWAGVVASYPDLLNNWRRGSITPSVSPSSRSWRRGLVAEFGEPEANPTFWNSISSNFYLADISGPLQLHHGTEDHSVPVEFSEKLEKQMNEAGKTVELYIYDGDDHNLAANLGVALTRSVEFFDKYLKN